MKIKNTNSLQDNLRLHTVNFYTLLTRIIGLLDRRLLLLWNIVERFMVRRVMEKWWKSSFALGPMDPVAFIMNWNISMLIWNEKNINFEGNVFEIFLCD